MLSISICSCLVDCCGWCSWNFVLKSFWYCYCCVCYDESRSNENLFVWFCAWNENSVWFSTVYQGYLAQFHSGGETGSHRLKPFVLIFHSNAEKAGQACIWLGALAISFVSLIHRFAMHALSSLLQTTRGKGSKVKHQYNTTPKNVLIL